MIQRYQDLIKEQQAAMANRDNITETYDGLTVTRRDEISAISHSEHFEFNMSLKPPSKQQNPMGIYNSLQDQYSN